MLVSVHLDEQEVVMMLLHAPDADDVVPLMDAVEHAFAVAAVVLLHRHICDWAAC